MTIDSSILQLRPRFRVEVDVSKSDLLDRFSKEIKPPNQDLTGLVRGNHVILDIREEHLHYWSPQLNMRVESDPNDDARSIVSGLIGPRPNVWTLFMFVYFSLGTVGFVLGSIGVSRLLLGVYSHFLWAFPIAVLFMLSAYLTSKRGERLASEQTEELKQFVREVIYPVTG